MHPQTGPFDMAEGGGGAPRPGGRSLDQPRNVSDHKGTKRVDLDGSQVWSESGEGIIRDLRMGGRDAAEERRFSGVGKADQADVGQEFQGEVKQPLLSLLARLSMAGRLANRGGESGIASAALPSPGNQHLLSVVDQVCDELTRLRIHDNRAKGYRDDQIGASPAVHRFAAAMRAVFRPILVSVFLVAEGPVRAIGDER